MYLGRLPYHVREDDVERFVKGYGRVRDIMLKNGYGFVVRKIHGRSLLFLQLSELLGKNQ